MKRIAVLLASTAALAALTPGGARADNAALTGTVTKWTLRIAGPARNLTTEVSKASTPDEALPFLRRFTSTAANGAAAISRQQASSAKGRKLKLLATRAFTNYQRAGTLLISAVLDIKVGKDEAAITPKVNDAVRLAGEGSIQLRNAGALIPSLVR